MTTNELTTIKIWKKTRALAKQLALDLDQSMVQTIQDALVHYKWWKKPQMKQEADEPTDPA